MNRTISILLLFFFWPFLSFAGEELYNVHFVIDPLDKAPGWNIGGEDYGSGTAIREYTIKDAAGNPMPVLGLTYNLPPWGKKKQSSACQRHILFPDHATTASLHIKADGSNHNLWVYLVDAKQETHIYQLGKTNFTTWKTFSLDLDKSDIHTGGDFDGILQRPLYFEILWVSRIDQGAHEKGLIYFDQLSVSGKFPESECIRISAETSRIGNIFTTEDPINFDLSFKNLLDKKYLFSMCCFVTDLNRHVLWEDDLSVILQPFSTAKRKLSIPLTHTGCYTLHLRGQNSDRSVAFQKQFPFSRVYPRIENRGDGMFGICTSLGQNKGFAAYNMSLAALAGFQWIRDEMYWKWAEPTKGDLRILPAWERYVREAEKNGLRILLTLNYGNKYYDDGGPPYTKEGVDGFSRYAKSIGQHFKGRINHFEVWNEYNFGSGKDHPPWDYLKMQKGVYDTLKGIDPAITIVGGSVGSYARKWINWLFVKGGLDTMDVFSIIPHIYPGSPEDKDIFGIMTAIQNQMKTHGKTRPIWITEIGWPTHEWSNGVSEELSAAYLVRLYVSSLSFHTPHKIFWYNLQNDGINIEINEQNFGLLRSWDVEEVPWSAKAGFVAMNNLTHRLHNMMFEQKLANHKKLRAFLFGNKEAPDEKLLVAWCNHDSVSCGIQADCQKVESYDLVGRKTNLSPTNGIYSLLVTDYPLFVQGKLSNVTLTDPEIKIADTKASVVAGDILDVTIIAPTKEDISISPLLPMNWKVLSSDAKSSGTKILRAIRIKTSIKSEPGDYEIPVKVKRGAKNLARICLRAQVTPPFTLEVKPEIMKEVKKRRWGVRADLTNHSRTQAYQGRLFPRLPIQWAESIKPASLQKISARETTSCLLPYTEVRNGQAVDLEMELLLENGYSKKFEKDINFLAAVKAKTKVSIDGKIDEWDHAVPFYMDHPSQVQDILGWKGLPDISGRGRMQWDEENFYLCLEVIDDDHDQEYTGEKIWKGDSMQFGLDFEPANRVITKGHHEFGFALAGGKIAGWRWLSAYGKETGEFRNRRIVIARAMAMLIYEIAIPWSELLPDGRTPEPGEVFGFSLIINDVDKDGRGRGWIRYAEGIGRTKDPNLYARAVFAP